MIKEELEDILDFKRDLTYDEAYKCMDDLILGTYDDIIVSAFLIGLRMKGETVDEISGLTQSMIDHALEIDYKPDEYMLDSCGTGGDTFKTFNVSTVASIVASAGGAKISKHGNRSVSSKFGGADALEGLGVNIEMSPKQVANSIENINFAFIFAPKYHAATKNVMNVRKKLGTRTIFNLMGPFSCPGKLNARMTGIYDPNLVETMAQVAIKLGTKRGMIVHGFDNEGNPAMDEISNIGKTKVAFIDYGNVKIKYISPKTFGLNYSNPEDICAPDSAEEHLNIIKNILNNKTDTPKDKARLDLCLMNSASILYVSNKVSSLKKGVELSKKLIESGKAKEQLKKIIEYSHKKI